MVKGQSQALRSYRINFTQSIFLCTNPQCIFPLGYTPLDNIIANTDDLQNNHSLINQKKRSISALPVTHPHCVKRTKSDPPVLGEYISRHDNASPLINSHSSMPVVPVQAPEENPSRTFKQTDGTGCLGQSVSTTASSFSDCSSVCSQKPIISPIDLSRKSEPLTAVQDGFLGEVLQSEMVVESNGSALFHHAEPTQENLPRLLNSGSLESLNMSNEQTSELTSGSGKPKTLNVTLDAPKSGVFHSDSVDMSAPLPMVQNSQLDVQEKETTLQEILSPPCNGGNPMIHLGDKFLESVQSSDLLQTGQSVCESMVSCALQKADSVVMGADSMLQVMCEEVSRLHVQLSSSHNLKLNIQTKICDGTDSNAMLHLIDHEQNMNEGYLPKKSTPLPSMESMMDNSSGLNPNPGVLDETDSMQDAYLKPLHSLPDTQLVGSFEDNKELSVPTTVNDLIDGKSVESTSESLSQTPLLAKDFEINQVGTQPDCLSKDSPVSSMSEVSNKGCIVENSCFESPKDALSEYPIVEPNLIHDTELATVVQSLQNLLFENKLKESPSMTMSDTHPCTTPVKNNTTCADQKALSIIELPEPLNLVQSNPTCVSDITIPCDPIQDIQPVCQSQDHSFMDVSDPICAKVALSKNYTGVEQETASLADSPLSEPMHLIQGSEKCNYVTSTPSLTPSVPESCMNKVRDSMCSTTADPSAPLLPEDQFPDCQLMDTCETTGSTNLQVKESSPDGVGVKDIDIVKPSDVSLSDCDLPVNTQNLKKPHHEITVLPDLLLDIQPEHLMEESLSAANSPACDEPVSVTSLEDSNILKQSDLLQDEKMEAIKMSSVKTNLDVLKTANDHSEDTPNGDFEEDSESMVLSSTDTDSPQVLKTTTFRTFDNTQKRLQWKNKFSLCWLDCILATLVHSAPVGKYVSCGGNKESIIHHLFGKYDEAMRMISPSRRITKSGQPKNFEICLDEVRMDIFEKLKPLLRCELGQNESPVFAFPLLLKQDKDLENLFVHSFVWKFKCQLCGYDYQERCQKTLTTFTNISPDWRPLNAVHIAPCNKCQDTDQKREMVLEELQSTFMVHFVEGLPNNVLEEYSFQFNGHFYEVRTIIRYKNDHFSAWIANDDGSWLEADGLKGFCCRRHHKIRIRADDIHIVIWERSDPSKIREHTSQLNETNHEKLDCDSANLFTPAKDQVYDLSDSIESCKQFAPPVALPAAAPPIAPCTSDPLSGMEGYADDDIITLTLVEIPLDSMGNPIENHPTITPINTIATQNEESKVVALHTADPEVFMDSSPPPQHMVQRPSTMSSPVSRTTQSDTKPSPNLHEANTTVSLQTPPLKEVRNSLQPPQNTDKKAGSRKSPRFGKSNEMKSVCNTPQKEQSPVKRGTLPPPQLSTPSVATASSIPVPKPYNVKKSVVGNWMSSLVSKDHSLLNSRLNGSKNPATRHSPPLKGSDLNGIPKKAENFDGFHTRGVTKINSLGSNGFQSNPVNMLPEKQNMFLTPSPSGGLKPKSGRIDYSKLLLNDGTMSHDDKIRKLRMKLLKKLKSKKNELAMLEKMTKKTQQGNQAAPAAINRREHLRGFLKELQEQMDNTDNESVGTASSSTSICSSPGDAEFFAELFSPSPMDNAANDSRYLEMLADGHRVFSDHSHQANGDKNPMDNRCSEQATSGNNTYLETSTLKSSSGEESFNIMSSSTLDVLNQDNGYFNFDDLF